MSQVPRSALLSALLLVAGCSNPGTPASSVSASASSSAHASGASSPPASPSGASEAHTAATPPPAPAPSAAPTLAPQTISADLKILQSSRDRAALERAAIELAGSGDPGAIRGLGELLGRAEFLSRLDDVKSPPDKTQHLHRVMEALTGRPTAETGALCLRLAADPVFLADPDRKIDLLPALAAVWPMSEEAARVFGQANGEGYFSSNLPLLVKNGSPRALGLFEAMVRDKAVPAERRVDAIHAAVLPRRAELEVLRSIDRLVSSDLEDEVAVGLFETVFDHQSRRWFGPTRNPPAPPPWETAPRASIQIVLSLAEKARAKKGLSAPLLAAVDHTAAILRALPGR